MYNWWNILIFGVIPVLTVAVIFIVKRKFLWTAPLISAVLAFITYMISLVPITMVEIFQNNEWRGFLFLAMFMQLVITAVLTVVAYFAAYILKRKQLNSRQHKR